METISINTKQNNYNVYIGHGLRFKTRQLLPKKYEKILIITDTEVKKYHYLNDVHSSISTDNNAVYTFVLPSGEQSKSMEQFEKIQTYAIQCGLNRQSLIITLGGGVVGDIGGFVAATYMRGIDYIQIPTTVLAHDSSVGGKVAINHPLGKNLIGSFHQPSAVIYDLETLSTLPPKEFRSGFAEVIKHALIADEQLLHTLMNHVQALDSIDENLMKYSLVRGIEIKSKIVEQDENEHDVRSYLNFGHTLGHAIETEIGYGQITHGEAVAIGMLFALQVSNTIFSCNLFLGELYDWFYQLSYPINKVKELNVASLVEQMKRDKKNEKGHIRMVLLEKIGSPELVKIDNETITSELTKFIKGVTHDDKGI